MLSFNLAVRRCNVTLRQDHRLRVIDNRVLRKTSGPKWGWRRLHKVELNDLHCSSNIFQVMKSRKMRWVGHVERMGRGRDVYRVLVGKPEGKRPLGRHGRRWEGNIKIDLRKWDVDV
jgi:hypothetical protein